MMLLVVLPVVAYIATYVLVAVLRHGAERLGVLDRPNDRSLHERPTPRGGGLAIVVVSLALIAIVGAASGHRPPASVRLITLASVVAGMGLLDDVRSISAGARLGVQFVVAAAAVFWGDGGGLFQHWQHLRPEVVAVLQVLAIMWIVGMINAYNFMDGIDGIAGIQAVIAAAAWAVMAYRADLPEVVAVALILMGAAAGFADNWAPARIFLGDVGERVPGIHLCGAAAMDAR